MMVVSIGSQLVIFKDLQDHSETISIMNNECHVTAPLRGLFVLRYQLSEERGTLKWTDLLSDR